MSDGLYTGQGRTEPIQQSELTRHRLLCVNVSTAGFKNPRDSSSFAGSDPNFDFIPSPPIPEGGPHFVMSPQTPDGSKSYGFEFTLALTGIPVPEQAVPLVGGFTITWWEMIGTTQLPTGLFGPIWAAFLPQTGVNVQELYHSFDVNATALRIQVTNVEDPPLGGLGGSILIMFSEL